MKRFATFLLILPALAFSAQPNVIDAPVKHLYVPHGFDNNDSVEVVITGEFPNTCYTRNTVEVSYQKELINIKVTALEPTNDNRVCAEMIVPFKEVVSLGNLQGGKYKVIVNEKSDYKLEDELKIVEASSNSIDDYMYAAVDFIEKVSQDKVYLNGYRYSTCIEIDRVEVISNNKDTLSVLPIMKQVSDFCPRKMTPYSVPVSIDLSTMTMKAPLIHVRTMDGRSVNTILNALEVK
jgi:hypothetical protein